MSKSLSIFQPEGAESACSASVKMNIQEPNYSVQPELFRGRAAVVTLGCAKNQVDSEVMAGVLRNSGFEIVTDLAEADVAIVNTCGFLESAVKESIDAVLNAAEYKEKGRLRKLIVAGCAVERYRKDLEESLPEADAFLTTDDILKVGDAASEGMPEMLESAARPYFLYDDTMPRELATKRHTAYVKVAEGCNRPCTFCIIPRIRGEMRSRPPESVVKEIISLGEAGVREVNLVAQDLTSYGKDQSGVGLASLLKMIDDAKAVDWVRLLYAYPIGIDEELIDAIANLPTICSYLDLPLQHASERVLKDMKRPLGKYSPKKIVEFMKTRFSELHLRTTFIVGFPGETEADVDELEAFVRAGHFSSVGIFTYSPEQGTPAYSLPGQVSAKAKESRRKRVMQAQQDVISEKFSQYIGKTELVLIEGSHQDTDLLLTGRAYFQAPDVDSTVIINDVDPQLMTDDGSWNVSPGGFYPVTFTELAGYDLVGRVVGPRQ